jgi:hypothetical protein
VKAAQKGDTKKGQKIRTIRGRMAMPRSKSAAEADELVERFPALSLRTVYAALQGRLWSKLGSSGQTPFAVPTPRQREIRPFRATRRDFISQPSHFRLKKAFKCNALLTTIS